MKKWSISKDGVAGSDGHEFVFTILDENGKAVGSVRKEGRKI